MQVSIYKKEFLNEIRSLVRPSTFVTIQSWVNRYCDRWLPQYTMKTRQLPSDARALRDVFKQARGPEQLLFVDLPTLMDCRPFAPDDADEENAASFFARWNTAMTTLTNSYEDLLQRIEDSVSAAFGTGDWAELRARSAAIGAHLSEPALVAFVQRAADETLERGKWLESIAAVVTGRPPFAWSDAEEKRFVPLLQPLAAAFSHSELLAFEKDKQAGKASNDRLQFSLMPASARPVATSACMV